MEALRPAARADLLTRFAATLVAAFAVAAAVVAAPAQFRAVNAEVDRLMALSPAERPLVAAFSTDIDRTFLVRAREIVPPDARYAVVTGSNVGVSSQTTLDALKPYAAYWLGPRIQVAEPHEAEWVLSFGGDLDALGLSFRRVVDLSPGLALGEVERP